MPELKEADSEAIESDLEENRFQRQETSEKDKNPNEDLLQLLEEEELFVKYSEPVRKLYFVLNKNITRKYKTFLKYIKRIDRLEKNNSSPQLIPPSPKSPKQRQAGFYIPQRPQNALSSVPESQNQYFSLINSESNQPSFSETPTPIHKGTRSSRPSIAFKLAPVKQASTANMVPTQGALNPHNSTTTPLGSFGTFGTISHSKDTSNQASKKPRPGAPVGVAPDFDMPSDISALSEGMSRVVRPFRGVLVDTSERKNYIGIKVDVVGVKQQEQLIVLEIKYTHLKSLVWCKIRVNGHAASFAKHRKAFHKYWFLMQDALQTELSSSSQKNTISQKMHIHNESLSHYNEGHQSIVREVMCLALFFFSTKVQVCNTLMGQRFEPLDSKGASLYLLKRYLYRKNLNFVNKKIALQEMTTTDETNMGEFYKFVNYKTAESSPEQSPTLRKRKRGRIPMNVLFNQDFRRKATNRPGTRVKGFDGIIWNDQITQEDVELPVGRLIHSIRPLATVIVRYENEYYICQLTIEGVDKKPPQDPDESFEGYAIEDYYTQFLISARGNETIFSELIKMQTLSDFLEISLLDLKTFIVKRVTGCTISKTLTKRIKTIIIDKARKLDLIRIALG